MVIPIPQRRGQSHPHRHSCLARVSDSVLPSCEYTGRSSLALPFVPSPSDSPSSERPTSREDRRGLSWGGGGYDGYDGVGDARGGSTSSA